MALFTHYIKISYRNILKRKGQSIIGIIGLAMSILAFTFFMYTFRFLSDLNYKVPHHKRIVRVIGCTDFKKEHFVWNDNIINQLQQTDIQGIQSLGVVSPHTRRDVTYFIFPDGKEIPYKTHRTGISKNILDIFSITLVNGSKEDLFKTPGQAIIAESAANKIFGDKSPIGCTIEEKGDIYTIQGVMRDLPIPNSISAFEGIDYVIALTLEDIYREHYQIYSLLDGKTPVEQINSQLRNCGIRQDDFFPYLENQELTLFTPEGINTEVLTFIFIGLLVLMTGIINFLSINIGTFYNRNKELVLRKVIGSTTGNLFSLLFTELSLLTGTSFLLTLCLTEGILPLIIDKINFTDFPFFIPTGLLIKSQFKYFFLIWLFCAFIAFCSVVRLERLSIMQGFKGGNYNYSKHRFRNIMLGVQFFISILFIGFTAICHMQSRAAESHVFSTYSASEQKRTFYIDLQGRETLDIGREVIHRLKNHPAVEDVLVMGDHIMSKRYRKYLSPDEKEHWIVEYTGNNFAQFLHIPLLTGDYIQEPHSILVNQKFFTLLDTEQYNGNIQLDGKNYKIAGVVDDFETQFGNKEDKYFFICPEETPRYCIIKSQPGLQKELEKYIQTTLRGWIPETLPLPVQRFDKVVGISKIIFEASRNAILFLAVICLSLTLLGIYSAITLDTEKKQKEVGIRKVNGATMQDIAIHFGKLYVYIYFVTVLLAFPVFLFICNFMYEQFNIVYNFKNPFFWIFLILILLLIILSIIGYRLYKIARINPAEVIKTE